MILLGIGTDRTGRRTEISLIICTYNRRVHVRETLRLLSQVPTPVGLSAELLVVDNASHDLNPWVVEE